MYIRWKRQRRRDIKRYEWGAGTRIEEQWLLSASLVEARRVDGAPRQRTIAYLGSIREGQMTEAGPASRFWSSVERKLDELVLSDDQRATIESRLTDKVPRPSDEATAQYWAALDARINAVKALAGGR
jgi:hypothetical protein